MTTTMKVEVKGGTEFLVINTLGDSKHLNPFYINIGQIRYIREYFFLNEKKEVTSTGYALFVGSKMMITKDVPELDDIKIGGKINIGSQEFICAEGSGLTNKNKCKYFLNYQNAFYLRKYVDENVNKNSSQNGENSSGNDKFAVVTIDERIIPVDKL